MDLGYCNTLTCLGCGATTENRGGSMWHLPEGHSWEEPSPTSDCGVRLICPIAEEPRLRKKFRDDLIESAKREIARRGLKPEWCLDIPWWIYEQLRGGA